MKLVTFRTDAHDRGGILVGDAVIDLAHAFSWYEHRQGRRCDAARVADRYGKGVLGFVENAAEARPAADAVVDAWQGKKLPAVFEGRVLSHALRDVTLRAPIPKPPSMRDGYAFRQHVETARRNRGLEMIPEFDQFPVFYFTNHHGRRRPGRRPRAQGAPRSPRLRAGGRHRGRQEGEEPDGRRRPTRPSSA